LTPDLCIGQPSFNANKPNYPLGQNTTPSEKGIALNTGSVFIGAIAFDTQHNLWLADAGNNRVLRYAASDVAKGGFATTISATLEIGQLDFISRQPNLPATGVQTLNQLATPAAIAFDTTGRLYIADSDSNSINRVLVFLPPFTTGMSATRVMGAQPPTVTGAPPRTDPQIYAIKMFSPTAIFFLPGTQGIGVMDSGYSRILIFDPYDQWPDAATAVSPSAKALFGHTSGLSGINSNDGKSLAANDGNPQAAATTLARPQAAVLVNSELYVADTSNNRVIVLPLQNGNFGAASRVLGQDRFNTNSINLVEGREFFFLNGTSADAAVVIDSTGDTPHLYVSDPNNHRILGFRDVRKLPTTPGTGADIVIGQPDLATALCNYHTGDINQPTQDSLCHPVGLLVDPAGNLYVADRENGRVLRFPTPFSHQGNQQADLVLGKANFVTPPITDASARNMLAPYGLAFAGNNGLLVSDQALNRVLFFPFNKGAFTSADNGTAATKVFGQPDFTSSKASASDTGMSGPHHLSSDRARPTYRQRQQTRPDLRYDSEPPESAPMRPSRCPQTPRASSSIPIPVKSATDTGGNVCKYPRYTS
jgi:sugar lactone lactonase YvrE